MSGDGSPEGQLIGPRIDPVPQLKTLQVPISLTHKAQRATITTPTVATMNCIHELLGDPPFKTDQIFDLHRRAISLTNALESGRSVPPREVIPIIDMLQELLNIATSGYLPDILLNWRSSDDMRKSQSFRLPTAFEDFLKDLPFDLLVLRDQFFGSLNLPPLCKPHPEGATLCHHCNWILERIGDKPSCEIPKHALTGNLL